MNTITKPAPSIQKVPSVPVLKNPQPIAHPSITQDAGVTSDRVRARAYEIYMSRNANGAAGDPTTDWLQAERELNGAVSESTVRNDVEIKSRARGERLLASGK